MLKGILQRGEFEDKTGLQQLGGDGASAGEQRRVGHFSKGHPQGDAWRGQHGQPMQLVSKGQGEFGICDRIGNNVDWTLDPVLIHAELDNFNQRRHCNPTHPLAPASQIAAQSQAKHGKHFGQSAAFTGENDAETQVDNADSQVDGCIGCRLPLSANLWKKAMTGRRIFREDFIGTVAIEAHGRGAEKDFRTLLQTG